MIGSIDSFLAIDSSKFMKGGRSLFKGLLHDPQEGLILVELTLPGFHSSRGCQCAFCLHPRLTLFVAPPALAVVGVFVGPT
jgi:hypothetical protein